MKKTSKRLGRLCLLSFASLCGGLTSCDVQDTFMVPEGTDDAVVASSEKGLHNNLSESQAIAYVNLFGNAIENGATDGSSLRSNSHPKEISDLDFYIEGQDTLLFAVNYADNQGYVLLSGDNSSFPIIAHSDKGNLRFKDIQEGNPLYSVLRNYKDKIKERLHNPDLIKGEYYEKWKDLGKEGYQYEITPSKNEPEDELRAYRDYSSGKETIYPYTGKELDKWCQDGTFNSAAPNGSMIGCPAVAIGMLLYDCENRVNGNHSVTYPRFYYGAHLADSSNNLGSIVSKTLKQIADSIPGYSWSPGGSSATPENILIGLHKLGFKKARLVDYDFEQLYDNLSFKSIGYGGTELTGYRGVLIGGDNGLVGHIWFCDGYYEQSFEVTKKFWFIVLKRWTEYDDRLYMNWGWGSGQGNGWYCATDSYAWTSLDQGSVGLKRRTKMFVGLDEYIPTRQY